MKTFLFSFFVISAYSLSLLSHEIPVGTYQLIGVENTHEQEKLNAQFKEISWEDAENYYHEAESPVTVKGFFINGNPFPTGVKIKEESNIKRVKAYNAYFIGADFIVAENSLTIKWKMYHHGSSSNTIHAPFYVSFVSVGQLSENGELLSMSVLQSSKALHYLPKLYKNTAFTPDDVFSRIENLQTHVPEFSTPIEFKSDLDAGAQLTFLDRGFKFYSHLWFGSKEIKGIRFFLRRVS